MDSYWDLAKNKYGFVKWTQFVITQWTRAKLLHATSVIMQLWTEMKRVKKQLDSGDILMWFKRTLMSYIKLLSVTVGDWSRC